MTVKQRTRKVKLWSSPDVTTTYYQGPRLIVKVCGQMGATRIEATGELSPHCAQRLIVELRKGLRQIRADQLAMMDGAIASAEKPL